MTFADLDRKWYQMEEMSVICLYETQRPRVCNLGPARTLLSPERTIVIGIQNTQIHPFSNSAEHCLCSVWLETL